MKFQNKVVLITWASKGIWRATALSFAKHWAIVLINYLHSELEAKQTLDEVAQYSSWMILKCDVSEEEEVSEMIQTVIKEYGKLDILVNNAGGYIDWDEWNWNQKIWEESLKKNLVSAMNTSKHAAIVFQKQRSGVIVNVASRHSLVGQIDAISYAAAKAWIVSITQAYARFLAPYWRANAVSPWATNAWYWLTASKEELDSNLDRSPQKRLIEPQEIADTIIFLASNESKMITGQNILVDGGK